MKSTNDATDLERELLAEERRSNELDRLAQSYLNRMKHQEYGGLILKSETLDQWCLVTRDSSQVGKWRFNVCDCSGFLYHSTYDNAPITIREALEDGFIILCELDTIDNLSRTRQWKLGSQRNDLILQLNSGKLTLSEFQRRLKNIIGEN